MVLARTRKIVRRTAATIERETNGIIGKRIVGKILSAVVRPHHYRGIPASHNCSNTTSKIVPTLTLIEAPKHVRDAQYRNWL